MQNKRSKRISTRRFGCVCLAVCLLLAPVLVLGQSVQSDPVQAVLAWYRAFGNASGSQAQYNGTVGDLSSPFPRAYRLLSSVLQGQMSEAAFEDSYAQVAHLVLLQSHLAHLDKNAREAAVFVEEERTVVLDRTSSSPGIPAVVWYEGTVHLTGTSGTWQISAFDLHPEDIISMEYGGHEPWLADVDEVAKVAAGQFQTDNSNRGQPCSSTAPQLQLGIAEVEICGDHRYRVRLVKLHSGEWRAISADSVAAATISQ
jgi:hypothetical protein